MNHFSSSSCANTQEVISIEDAPFLYIEQVHYQYPAAIKKWNVRDISFSINQGDILGIVGESGSGKSTLLKIIYGLLSPEQGRVYLNGKALPLPEDTLIPGHREMKMVSQDFSDLNTYAKVWDNIASRLPNTDISFKESQTKKVMEQLRISHLAEKKVAELSGGEKQRVAIARALVDEPQILLMDEPFNQVDASFKELLRRDIKRIVDETGLTVIIVSHDPQEVLSLAQSILLLNKGAFEAKGSPRELYEAPPTPYVAKLLAKSNVLSSRQAQAFGIVTERDICIHREWVDCSIDEQGDFVVQDIYFRGFYSELLIHKDDIELHIVKHSNTPIPKIGQKLSVDILRFIEMQKG